jgi:hypothetical protein
MQSSHPFGNKTILLGGDFRQTLPVVPHANRSVIIESNIQFNTTWTNFELLHLIDNVRSEDSLSLANG